MRYLNSNYSVFTNSLGEERAIFDLQENSKSNVTTTVSKSPEEDFDAFAAIKFGNGAELNSYALREQNVEKLLQNNFDETKITKFETPLNL